MKKLTLLILIALVSVSGKIVAQNNTLSTSNPGWQKLGEIALDMTSNRDEIALPSNVDRFNSVKVVVTDAEIDLYGIEVFYKGGNAQIINVGKSIEPGQQSNVYPLRDGQKDLRSIGFAYKSNRDSNCKNAHVEIWGYKTEMYGDLIK